MSRKTLSRFRSFTLCCQIKQDEPTTDYLNYCSIQLCNSKLSSFPHQYRWILKSHACKPCERCFQLLRYTGVFHYTVHLEKDTGSRTGCGLQRGCGDKTIRTAPCCPVFCTLRSLDDTWLDISARIERLTDYLVKIWFDDVAPPLQQSDLESQQPHGCCRDQDKQFPGKFPCHLEQENWLRAPKHMAYDQHFKR